MLQLAAIKTQADVNAAFDEVWKMLIEGDLTLQECTVISKELSKRSENLLKASCNKLLKQKHQIEMV